MNEPLPSYSILAENDATESNNAIHSDDIAQKMGFTGGLVPGVTVYGYLMRPLLAHFGEDFLSEGFVSARFRRPVYEGEKVLVEGHLEDESASGQEVSLVVRNPAGEACAVAKARFPGAGDGWPPDLPPAAAVPAIRRPATPEELTRDPVLGTLEGRFDPAAAAGFLGRLGDDHPVYRRAAHPAWLLRQVNYAVDQNLELGPWIHVSSDVQQLGVVSGGEGFQIRLRAGRLYQKKSHDYADFDVAIVTDRPVMRILHRAIYRMGE